MADFPNIRLPSEIEETTEDPAIRTDFESGIVQSRARYTKQRRTWTLSWIALTNSEYQILRNFYLSVSGGSLVFSWKHPYEDTTFLVRFNGELKAKNSQRDYWDLSLTIEEN